VTGQDRPDRAGRDTELWSEPVLAATFSAAQLEDELLHVGAGAPRTSVRARGPVDQTGFAGLLETGDPPVCALPGDPQLLGDVSDRSAVIKDPLDEQTTTV
jgi:hypothetical protein